MGSSPLNMGNSITHQRRALDNFTVLLPIRECLQLARLYGPAARCKSKVMSKYADEKSDEVVVLRKRPNKGRQLPAEVVEGRASPKGNSRQTAVVRTLSRSYHVDPNAGCASSAERVKPRSSSNV